jgi:hypothetical protein
MWQGSRFRFNLQVTENGSVLNLTGYTARMQIRASVSDATVLAEYTTTNGMLVIDGAQGIVQIRVPSSETEDYTWESGVYDLEVVDGSNDAIRVMEGWVAVTPQVTR